MIAAGELADGLLQVLTWVASCAAGVVILMLVVILCNLRLLILRHRLNGFWDGAGMSKSETVYVEGRARAIRYRPRITRLRRTQRGFGFHVRLGRGNTWQRLADHADALAQHLRVYEIRVSPIRPGLVVVEAYRSDAAPEPFTASEFAHQVSAGPLGSGVVLGRTDDGELFQVGLGHTLVVGATGSGKGSLLWAYVLGVLALTSRTGSALRVYGYDPKRAELAGPVGRRFEKVAFDPSEGLALMQSLVVEMRSRQKLGLRSFVPGPDLPYILLVIDEFNSLLASADAAWKRDVRESLSALLSQGRSAGIYILAAAQQPQKETIGDYRAHFMNRLCLRVETAVEVDMVLGGGSAAEGAPAHLIVPATESNGYLTAGIGYARSDSEPVPVRFRAPRITDAELANWATSGPR